VTTDAGLSDNARLKALDAELEAIAERLVARVFGASGSDMKTLEPLSITNLRPIIEELAGKLWEAGRPVEALESTLKQAISKLEGKFGAPPDRPELISKKEAALRYFNLDGSPDLPGVNPVDVYDPRWEHIGGKLYYKVLASLAEAANLDREQKTFSTHVRKLRRELAETLLDLEVFPAEEHAFAPVLRFQQSNQYVPIVDRPEYIDRLQALVDAGQKVISIWGEPGTGKSTMAEQFARKLAGDTPPLIIHCAPMVTAITPEAETFGRDLANALVAEGVDSTKFSKEAWFSRLCEQLTEQPRSNVLVLDNIETNEQIAQVVQAQPKIPVIMTMRNRPSSSEIARERLDNFTEPQALEFIKRQLPDEEDENAKALAHILGCRPLALEHAVRFVREFPDISVGTLVHALATKVTGTLSAVTPLDEVERNLARLYERILASLEGHADVQAALDSFLAVVGGSGVGYREMVYLFMQSEVGGLHDRLHFRSALRELGRLGLVREPQNVMRRQPQESGLAERPQLAMHALTYAILRDLRGTGTFALESRYWDWVLQGGHQALPEDDTNAHEHAYLALLQWSLRAASGGLPRGWASFFCVDERTWLALMEADSDDESVSTYLVRYAVRPNAVYKLDYRIGRWSSMDGQEASRLFLLITMYYERIYRQLVAPMRDDEEELDPEAGSQAEQPRLDDEVTPADEYRHIFIDPLALGPCHDRGWSVWALCGKRFVPVTTAEDAAACLDCESLQHDADRLRNIETVLQRDFFVRLDYNDPVTATRLFLVRAKLRRELNRPEEAASDLDTAYDFLPIAADVPDVDVLSLGLAVIHEAASLPEPHRQLALREYDYLLWRLSDRSGTTMPAWTSLLLDRTYVFGSPVSRFAFALVGAVLLVGNDAISEYLRPDEAAGTVGTNCGCPGRISDDRRWGWRRAA
jgi:adenylate kinase family enzyme